MMDVSAWLRELGLECYAQAFSDSDVDGRTLPELTAADLAEIGVTSVGHRRKLIEAIAALKGDLPSPAAAAAPRGQVQAEHRQLSVLYCDMVGSTALSVRLDPEEYREVIRSFHDRCVRIVVEYDGWMANFIGDCTLAYFGWPRAHEDDPERAVRTGLALVQAVAGSGVEVRVGIATGLVVVGDLIREGPAQEQSAVGVAPNLAARLQTLAAPGQVVVDELTCRLAPTFAMQPLRPQALEGIFEPVTAYAVVGSKMADSRFDAHAGQDLSPMVGRDQELALLVERWKQAQGGEGQAVLLVGEAGIGKSRLAHALLDSCTAQHRRIRWQCSPYHTGSALWPVIQRLSRAAGLLVEDATEAAWDKLEAVMAEREPSALCAALLDLNGTRRDGLLEMTPQMLRERTLELLAEQLFAMAEQQPLLLVVEDAHWIDPTTLELLERCLERIDRARMLMLITCRHDNQPSLGAHPCITRLSLNRLSRASVHAIVARLGGDTLQADTRATIEAQTDGVPLFVEELTKAVLEIGEGTIPASLHGSLIARLDRVPEVKDVAQIAACIGRDFDQAMLMAVAYRPEAVGPAIDKLMTAGLVFRRGPAADPSYTFKHALVQQAAYESLLRGHRRAAHLRILEYLEQHSAQTQPDVLAWHAIRAGLVERAVAYEGSAAELALANSAHGEAVQHLSSALELVEANRSLTDWRTRELALRYRLGRAQISTLGFGSDATKSTHEIAYGLLDLRTDKDLRVPVLYGVWLCCSVRAELNDALRLAHELLDAAQTDADEDALLVAHRMVGATNLLMGSLDNAQSHLGQALPMYDAQRHKGLALALAIDPGLAASCYMAWTLCLKGDPQKAVAEMKHARSLAPAVPVLHANAYVHRHGALLSMLLRDPASVRADAHMLIELSGQARVRMWRGYADACLAWCALEQGEPASAVEGFERGLAELAVTGAKLVAPYFEACYARALGELGRREDACRVLEAAFAACERSALRWCEAELWRVRGELAGAGSTPEDDFARGLAVARRQGARCWELRCAESLARLRARQGRHAEAVASPPRRGQ